MQWITNADGSIRVPVVGGQWRDRPVSVGTHKPPDHRFLVDFLRCFEQAYSQHAAPTVEAIGRIAAAHHRLVWIHPFLDGNGRVARLMTDAMIERAGLGADGLWRISRGFARGKAGEYKKYLAAADDRRHHDTDGRGSLSQEALDTWCEYVLNTMLDQVQFMGGLLNLRALRGRIEAWASLERSSDARYGGAIGRLLAQTFFAGTVSRGEATALLGLSERYARTTIDRLVKDGLLQGAPREPLRPAVPLLVAPYWFPELFPADVEAELMEMGR